MRSEPNKEPAIDPETLDERLVARVLEGEVEAFRPLVERYEAAVFGLCRRLLGGDRAEAEDLAQETFLRALRCLEQLDDARRFGPWLFRVARSLARDRLRRLACERRAMRTRVELLRWESIREEKDDRLVEALGELAPEERSALELKYFDGLAYREIGERLGLSFSRVDHLIRQARARLSDRLRVRGERERRLQDSTRGSGALR